MKDVKVELTNDEVAIALGVYAAKKQGLYDMEFKTSSSIREDGATITLKFVESPAAKPLTHKESEKK